MSDQSQTDQNERDDEEQDAPQPAERPEDDNGENA